MLLNVVNLQKSYGDRDLFSSVSFLVENNDKIGFIGANGCGKSTLLKILAGIEDESGGSVAKGKDVKIGYLPQSAELDSDASVIEEVLKVFSDMEDMETELENIAKSLDSGADAALINRQEYLREQFENRGGYTYKARANAALIGLGFSKDELSKPYSALSGGQKTRVLLCKILLSESNLLLLDEPTNHLDIGSLSWLEDFLSTYNGAIIVISHDRYFLDRVTNKTFELEDKSLYVYNAPYSDYKKQKAVRMLTVKRNYEKTQKEIERLEGIIEQQKRWNREKNIKTAESKQKVIDRLAETLIKPTEEAKTLSFEFHINNSGPNEVLNAYNLSAAYGVDRIFENVSFSVRKKDKIVLLGENGCGKTTLFKTIIGFLKPTDGSSETGPGVQIAYYSQIRDDLDESNTIFDEIYDAYPKLTSTQIRNCLAAFLFFGEDVFKPISSLSGGEKARVSILKIMLSGANFLLLDEPTNHLDTDSREALEEALEKYEGTVFAISHDRYFINRIAGRIFHMHGNAFDIYEGNYDYFAEKSKPEDEEKKHENISKGKADYMSRKAEASKKRKLKNAVESAEKAISDLEEEISLANALLLTDEYSLDYIKADELTKKISSLEDELSKQYEIWESASSELSEYEE